MLDWLFGKRKEEPLPATRDHEQRGASPHDGAQLTEAAPASDTTDPKGALPVKAEEKLNRVRSRLASLVVVTRDEAHEQLEDSNAARHALYGQQAVALPITEGSADEVFSSLMTCIAADYRDCDVTSLYVEEAPAPATDEETDQVERARAQMPSDLDPRMQRYYDKKMMKHVRKKGGSSGGKGAKPIREIDVKVHFGQTFGSHRIIRVGEDSFCFMPCTVRG